jgi:hypothetical protein
MNDGAVSSPCIMHPRERHWGREGERGARLETLGWHTYEMTPECFKAWSCKVKLETM